MSEAARWKATVYVGGLSQMATQNHVLDAFIPFGEIVEVKVPKPDAPNSTETHRGFAYVEFEDAADAKEAIDNMDQSEFFGKVLKVSQAKAPKSAEDGLGSKTAIWEKEGWLAEHAADDEEAVSGAGPDPMQGLEQLDVAGPKPE
ncbi:peptidylprolyl isomerase [Fusarium pseudocircinatum]|uniref:Peptidylprolyl isomerase n=1 Tax=Fusarium pseudocircinatum TaxID=56676 RepID=A0A8H5KJS8_9HYPO|nr:peptidylprolyl isomerase [Fusarium pseudocircinatum]